MKAEIDRIANNIVAHITRDGRSPNEHYVGGVNGQQINDLIISKIPAKYRHSQGVTQQIVAGVQERLHAIAEASQSGNDSDYELELVGGARYTRRKKTKRKKTKRKKTKRKKSVRRKSSKRKKIRKH